MGYQAQQLQKRIATIESVSSKQLKKIVNLEVLKQNAITSKEDFKYKRLNAKVDILLNKNLLLKNGGPTNLSPKKLIKAMQQHKINITIDLHCGKEWEEILTCDLSYEYVKINAEYTT